MNKPIIAENFADNGAFSHFSLVDSDSNLLLWSEDPEEELAQGRKFAQKENAVAEKTDDNSDMKQLLCNTCKEFNVCELVAQKLRALECVEYTKA